jgi:hypothetical protein
MREFESGAIRDTAVGKPDYEGYLSPLVLKRFGEYMLKHQQLPDGSTRGSDNWQAGIPLNDYMKSGFRHFMEWWLSHRECEAVDEEEALCALMFNVMGYLHEVLKVKEEPLPQFISGYVDNFEFIKDFKQKETPEV